MYLLLARVYRQIEQHIPRVIPLSTSNNISISIKGSSLTLIFFKAACHAKADAVRKRVVSSSYISRHIEKSQIYLPAIMYHFEHDN